MERTKRTRNYQVYNFCNTRYSSLVHKIHTLKGLRAIVVVELEAKFEVRDGGKEKSWAEVESELFARRRRSIRSWKAEIIREKLFAYLASWIAASCGWEKSLEAYRMLLSTIGLFGQWLPILRRIDLLRWLDHSKAIWVPLTSTVFSLWRSNFLRGGNKRCYFFLTLKKAATACISKEPKIPESNLLRSKSKLILREQIPILYVRI